MSTSTLSTPAGQGHSATPPNETQDDNLPKKPRLDAFPEIKADELIFALAQELREYADSAQEAGCNIESTEGLLGDVDKYFNGPFKEDQ